MKAFYKLENNQAQVGSGDFIPDDFVEYIVGQEPEELQLALVLEKEADRVKAIKAKAGTLILSKYSIEKQSSANLGIYGQEYLDTMKAFIADVIKQSNELEADVSKTADDFVLSNIGGN